LSHDERKAAIKLTRQTLDENGFNNVLVIAGTGAQSTRETKKVYNFYFLIGVLIFAVVRRCERRWSVPRFSFDSLDLATTDECR
jgi:dihydrodipicolinate synthase/N-acetylneuraminate lyase